MTCLAEGGGMLKNASVILYAHFTVALLCLNVMFDLLVFGAPVFLLHKIGMLPNKLYLAITTFIINWTTPIVFTMPMILTGSKVYCNDLDLLVECKETNSLLLSNHGSRIDWMVGMFVGFSKSLADRAAKRIRVGFVCEALIQFMPLIGWYRKIVAKDIFVWRSFKSDAPTIKNNIQDFHRAECRRMLFLSPEGVVVDFGPKDTEYIDACRRFCLDQNYEPFEYVLTPRYKGSMCLLQQVQNSTGPVVSICIAYVRNGKLLNCKLLSRDRVVPDIYTLNQGVGGSPVDVFIHLKRLHIAQSDDPKSFMMENYKEKNELMKEWDEQLVAGKPSSEWLSQFFIIEANYLEGALYQIGHALLMVIAALAFDRMQTLLKTFSCLVCLVAGCHSLGCLKSSTSMESVPFETGIKSLIALYISHKNKSA
ncbi:hypothetical protein ACHAWF_003964 [Thalassiosira exigua]